MLDTAQEKQRRDRPRHTTPAKSPEPDLVFGRVTGQKVSAVYYWAA